MGDGETREDHRPIVSGFRWGVEAAWRSCRRIGRCCDRARARQRDRFGAATPRGRLRASRAGGTRRAAASRGEMGALGERASRRGRIDAPWVLVFSSGGKRIEAFVCLLVSPGQRGARLAQAETSRLALSPPSRRLCTTGTRARSRETGSSCRRRFSTAPMRVALLPEVPARCRSKPEGPILERKGSNLFEQRVVVFAR